MDLSDRIIMRISSHLMIRILSLSLSSALIRRASHALSLCLHLHSFAWFCRQFCVRVTTVGTALCVSVYACVCDDVPFCMNAQFYCTDPKTAIHIIILGKLG